MRKRILYIICIIFIFLSLSNPSSSLNFGQRNKNFSQNLTVETPAYRKGEGPIVLFDEGHNNHRDTAAYRAFIDIITNDGYSVVVNKERFTEDVLKGYDILIISNALNEKNVPWWGTHPYYPAFTQEEVNTVHKWVEEGGSLFLIADHVPFGTAAFDLAKKFEVVMSKGTAYDPGNIDVIPGKTNGAMLDRGHIVIFTRENNTLLDHPITRGRNESERIHKIRTFGGQSLLGPKGSGILKFGESAYDIAPISGEKRQIPAHLQGVGFSHGKGRVVVMGEARIFRFHSVISKGRVARKRGAPLPPDDSIQFLLNVMHYLTGLLEPSTTLE